MYINFTDIVTKYGTPKGVIHIGAHLLEERDEYLKHNLNNTIWIEANPRIIESITGLLPTELLINHTISDKDNISYTFNITNNNQSSSILELDLHSQHHPEIFVTDTICVKSKRMDTIIDEYNIDINNYDFLNIDIQGAELLALKGFGDMISNFKYIYTEVNSNFLYKDCALIDEIDHYLAYYGFKRLETFMTDAEWGDALYVKVLNAVKLDDISLIFDIGGHYGGFTDDCLIKYPDSKIVIVEANEDLYFRLQQKYLNNPNVVVLNYLVSDKTAQQVNFYLCDSDQISTASIDWVQKSRFSDQNWNNVIPTKTINLDTLIKIFGKPSLTKIDVEGYEYNVITGLSNKIGEICFEWAEEEYDKINLCCEYLQNLGYNNFGYILEDEYLKRPQYYTTWNKSDFHSMVKPDEKSKWGMIWTF